MFNQIENTTLKFKIIFMTIYIVTNQIKIKITKNLRYLEKVLYYVRQNLLEKNLEFHLKLDFL